MIELYIDEQRVVLKGSEVIAPTYQAFDVGDITKIKFDFTNTFTLPFCDVNNEIFENSFKVQSQSAKRFQANSCKLINGGREILANGIAEYIGSNNEGYQIVCYSAPLEFFNEIAGKNIRDLDYTGYSHDIEATDIVSYQANTSLFSYPIIDYFTESPNSIVRDNVRTIDTRYLLPTFFYHEILKKIFTEKKYAVDVRTEMHPMFQEYDLMFSSDGENYRLPFFNAISSQSVNSIYSTTTVVAFAPIGFEQVSGNKLWKETIEDTYTTNILGHTPTLQSLLTIDFFTPDKDDFYSINVQAIGTKPQNNAGTIYISLCRLDGNNLTELNRVTQVLAPLQQLFNITYPTPANLVAGEKYCFILTIDISPGDAQFTLTNTGVVFKSFRSFAENAIPDIEQTKFIKNYLQLTGSILTFDKYTNTFIIERFDKILENKSIAKDWSDKIWDNKKKPAIKHKIGSYAVANKFTYKEDEKDFKPVLADGFLNSNNENLDKEKTVVELDFAGSLAFLRYSGILTPSVKIFGFEDGEALKVNDVVPRLFLVRRETLSNVVTFNDGTNTANTTVVAIAHFIDLTQNYSLGFDSNILDTFYQWLQSILNDPIVLDEELKLNANDVTGNELDFLIPVYFQQHNSYFYINKINSFLENKKTKTQLIKI